MHRARVAALMLCFTALLLAPATHADQEPVLLRYEALPGCPSRAEFVRQVDARTLRASWVLDHPSARRFAVVIGGSPEAPSGALTIVSAEGSAKRVVQGDSCQEVVAALALITAVAIDPQVELSAPIPPARSGPGEGTAAFASPRPTASGPAPAAAEPPFTSGPPPAAPRSPARHSRSAADLPATDMPPYRLGAHRSRQVNPSRWRWTIGLGASAASGLDSMGLQIPIFLDLERSGPALWSPALRVAVVVTPSQEVNHARGASDFKRYAGALSGCPLWFQIHPTLGLRPCLALEAGALLARGKVEQGVETTTAWVAVLAPVRLQWSPARWALLEIQGELGVPLVQPRFYFEPDSTVVTYDPVFGTIGANVGVRFP